MLWSWHYNSVMRAHPNMMAPRVARGTVQAGFISGNQTKQYSRANALRSTQRLAPIVNSESEQRRRAQVALATPPTEPIVLNESNAAAQDSALVRVQPHSLRVKRGQDVQLSIALDASDLAVVEWRAYTPSTDDERIVRNNERSMSDAPVADTVYNVLFQAHERKSGSSASQQLVLVGHHYEVHVRVDAD